MYLNNFGQWVERATFSRRRNQNYWRVIAFTSTASLLAQRREKKSRASGFF
jgi:hypothetical protein